MAPKVVCYFGLARDGSTLRQAGLVLEAGGPGRAARLEADAEGFYFVPEVEGFTVGGRPVQGRRLLRAGDLVVGPGVRFRFHPVESPEDLWS